MRFFADFRYNTTDTIPTFTGAQRLFLELPVFNDKKRQLVKEDTVLLNRSIIEEVDGYFKLVTVQFFANILQNTSTTIVNTYPSNNVTPQTFFEAFFNAKHIWAVTGTEAFYSGTYSRWFLNNNSKYSDPANAGDSGLCKSILVDSGIIITSKNFMENGFTLQSEKMF